MPQWPSIVAAVAAAVLLKTSAVSGQQPGAMSFDVTLGGGAGFGGGEVHERGGVALDGILGLRFVTADRHVFLAAIGAGFQGVPVSSDVCYVGTRGQCLDDFPALATVGLFAGWEHPSDWGVSREPTLSLLAGPAYVHLDRYVISRRASALGLQARADVASRPAGPVAAVLSVRGTVVPRVSGRTLGALALGVGIGFR